MAEFEIGCQRGCNRREETLVDGVEIAAEGVEEKAVSVVEEDESEWPSLKLDVSEAVIEEEETLVDGGDCG